MKQLVTAGILFAGMGLYGPSTAAAEGQFYVAPGIQWMNFEDGLDLDNDEGYSWGIGYDFTDRLSFELSGMDVDPKTGSGSGFDIDHYRGDIYLHFPRGNNRLTPFVSTGFGNMNFDGENDTAWDYGAGVNVRLGDNWSWRTAVRGFTYLGRDHEDGDYGIDSSIIFRFPARSSAPVAAAPAPAPAPQAEPDADGDGVPDSRDACPDTPRTYAVDDRGCPIPLEEVARIDLQVNFDFDRAEVKPEYFSEIRQVADFMTQYPDVVVELEGHTDSTGTEEYNQGLSQRRVNAVREVLISQMGMQASRITATGYGETRPVASNSTSEGRAQNRRVVSVIIKALQRYQPR